jgi:hypothetical protein
MNADATVLGLLAIADLVFLKYLRHRRWVAIEQERMKDRMARTLATAVRRETNSSTYRSRTRSHSAKTS